MEMLSFCFGQTPPSHKPNSFLASKTLWLSALEGRVEFPLKELHTLDKLGLSKTQWIIGRRDKVIREATQQNVGFIFFGFIFFHSSPSSLFKLVI